MKIVLVSQEYPPDTAHGGIASQTFLKAHGLARMGHEAIVLSHSLDERTHEMRDGRVRVIRIPGFDDTITLNNEEVRWLNYSERVAAKLNELNVRLALDLIDFVEWGAEGFFYLLNRSKRSHVPCVVHIQGPMVMLNQMIGWPDSSSEFFRVGSFMEGTCLRLADAVYSSSKYSADWCRKSHCLEYNDIPVIHAGVDTKHFYARDVSKAQNPTIIFVGRIAESKGAVVLFQAALKLAKEIPNLRLQMIGRCNNGLLEKMKSEANAASFPDLLDTPGFITKEELPDFLSRARVFAAPSFCEGGPGFVYLEAMACGLPVIGCEGSGVNEVIAHGKTGYLVPPGDIDSTVSALKEVLLDPAKRERMSREAKKYIEQQAATDICVRKIEKFYQSVVP